MKKLYDTLMKFSPGAFVLIGLLMFLKVVTLWGHGHGYDSIPAVQVLYWAAEVGWMIQARAAVHGAVAISAVLIGVLLLENGAPVIRTFKIRATTVACLMLVTSVWNVTMLGTVLYGGVWHFSSVVFGTLDALMIICTAIILVVTQSSSNLKIKSRYVKKS